MEDKLEEIKPIDFASLRDLYKVEWPKYILASNLFEILRQKRKSCSKVFCINGNWGDGTFVAFMVRRLNKIWRFHYFKAVNFRAKVK